MVYVQSTTSMSLDEYIYLAFRNNGCKAILILLTRTVLYSFKRKLFSDKYTSMKWTVILVASLVLVKNVLLWMNTIQIQIEILFDE